MTRGVGQRVAWVVLAVAAGSTCRAPEPAPSPQQAVTVSVPYELDTLDPHARDLLGQAAIGAHFYEPLVTMAADMSLQPALAVRWVNPDANTWVFTLRPGVTFHDGHPLTSADVVFSIERLKAPALQVGSYVGAISAVRASGPLGVEIRTRRPASVLLNKLSGVLVVPAGASAAALAATPNGTGPYRFVSWRRGERIEMIRNESYWGERPALRRVTFRLAREDAEAISDVAGGASHIAQCASHKAEAVAASGGPVRLVRQRSVFLKYLGYDLHRPVTPGASAPRNPFRDLRVREAIHLAIDRQRLVAQLPIFAEPAGQLVPPLIFGFNPAIGEPAPNLARARELLAAAGLADGFDVTLHARQMVGHAADPIAAMLREVGIRVSVTQVAEEDFFRLVDQGPSFYLTRFGCDNADASDILNAAIHSVDPESRFGNVNFGRYSNPGLDRLIEASAGELDHDKRRRSLQDIMAAAMADLPLIPLYFDEDVYLVRRGLSFRPRADSLLLASEIGLEPEHNSRQP